MMREIEIIPVWPPPRDPTEREKSPVMGATARAGTTTVSDCPQAVDRGVHKLSTGFTLPIGVLGSVMELAMVSPTVICHII